VKTPRENLHKSQSRSSKTVKETQINYERTYREEEIEQVEE
jgi:hypothetical protein